MEKKGLKPAFPQPMNPYGEGISKRFFAACMAMQGLLSEQHRSSATKVAVEAFEFADALLEQEAKEAKEE